jgi:cysteine desulfurase
MQNDNIIFLDNASTTRVDDKVIEAMLPFYSEFYGNPSSSHKFGSDVNSFINKARKTIANFLNCEPYELIFTSGATESINLAIKGIAESLKSKGNHIITVSTEHSAVLDTCKHLQSLDYDITYLTVKADGLLDIEQFIQSFKTTTILVSVMFVNNETGVIQPIKELVEIAHKKGSIFLTDATQAIGKIKVDVKDLNVDLLAFSGHKFHGPKGVGGLVVRKNNKVILSPIIHGGQQEMRLRSGTLNVPSIIGLSKAIEICSNEMSKSNLYIAKLRDRLEGELLKIEGAKVNGNSVFRANNISNILFRGIDSDAVISGLTQIAISKGSACSSSSTQPSHVLKGIGLSDEEAYSSIRFSFSKYNTEEEIDIVVKNIKDLINNLKRFNHSKSV